VRLAAKYNLRVNTLVRDTLDEVLKVFLEVEQEFTISDCRWMIGHVRETLSVEIAAVESERNQAGATINWRFSTVDARVKLHHLYPDNN